MILPSALLVHCNLHAADFKVLVTKGEELAACEEVEERVRFAWFSQANDIITREVGSTLKDAREAGRDSKCTYNLDVFKHTRSD